MRYVYKTCRSRALQYQIVPHQYPTQRMYGELTGLSKQMVKQRHGEAQFNSWRRGYNVKYVRLLASSGPHRNVFAHLKNLLAPLFSSQNRPPPVSSFSPNYPGNDVRYRHFLKDIRYSVKESVIRSIEMGEPTLHRKLPKSESLKDCMDRTIPYFTERIVKDAVNQGKRVLISSSENAIRGLLMHLCEIPEEEITGLEIPNGLPLIFDVRSKCVKVSVRGQAKSWNHLNLYSVPKLMRDRLPFDSFLTMGLGEIL
jgi:bisphosphoglycerate-dependent phosphoglycerate mutase